MCRSPISPSLNGDEPDAEEAQPLVEGGDILLIAAQAIERLGEHHVDAAFATAARSA
jgi:hypothetical protein